MKTKSTYRVYTHIRGISVRTFDVQAENQQVAKEKFLDYAEKTFPGHNRQFLYAKKILPTWSLVSDVVIP